ACPASRRIRGDAPPGLLLQKPNGRGRTRLLQATRAAGGVRSVGGDPMNLAFSTNAYLKYSFTEAVSRLAKIGYRGIEIMADVPHAWPAFLLPEQRQAIRNALAANKLAISNINAFMMHAVSDERQLYWHPSWIEPDLHYRKVRVNHTKRA